jgi:hypothetical protein
MGALTFCSNCGKELVADASYCIHCGARVGGYWHSERWRERDWARARRHAMRERGGWWGGVSAFGFLIIMIITVSNYPNVFSLVNSYLLSWGTYGHPVLPGHPLGQIIIYFLTACGVWGIVSACLRFAFTNSLRRPMRNIVGALFSLYLAGSLSQFYAGTITGTGLVVAFFVGLAFVIAADAAIAFFFPRRLRMMAFRY